MELVPSDPSLPARTAAYQLRKVERRLELTRRLASALPSGRTFVWEVGCGHGHFLTAFAQAHPQLFCVGIDIMGERIDRALRKRDRARLENLVFLHADARTFLEAVPPENLASQIFLLFPDPWPKVRHHKHRVLNADFLTNAARHSTPHCRLCFRTDYLPYFEQVQSLIRRHPDWTPVAEPWPFEFETVFQARADHHHSFIARQHSGTPSSIS